MSENETDYLKLGSSIEGAVQSQMFGKPCFKIGGKAFTCFFQNAMVFKLTGDDHAQALALDGAVLFDPSGKGRAMREWVQVPMTHIATWPQLALAASTYVSG